MSEYKLICCGCQVNYISKYKPKGNVWYHSKSCANHHKPRRCKEGKCKCGIEISTSRKFCKPCLLKHIESRKIVSKQNKKLYMREKIKSYVRRLKEQSIEYKGGKCQCCGYNKYNGSLHFHHIKNKSFSISGKSISFERLKPELDKCILVCANCHGEIHGNIIKLE